MNILITGGTGFLGKSFVDVVQNIPGIKFDVVTRKQTNDNSNFIKGDLGSKEFLTMLLKKNYDKIFHFAWEGLPDLNDELCEKNYNSTINLITILRKSPKTELHFIGSCLEYGPIFNEVSDFDIPKGNSRFAQSKININSELKKLAAPYKWYRPFYVFGLNQSKKSLIPSTITAASKGRMLNYKNPNSAHDFITVEDLSDAIKKIAFDTTETGEFNIGTGILTSVGEIASKVYNAYGQEFIYEKKSIEGLSSKNVRLKALFNWEAKYVGIEGINTYLREKKYETFTN